MTVLYKQFEHTPVREVDRTCQDVFGGETSEMFLSSMAMSVINATGVITVNSNTREK